MIRPGGDVLSHAVTFNSELNQFAVDAFSLFRARSVRALFSYDVAYVGQPCNVDLNARGARWVDTALKN